MMRRLTIAAVCLVACLTLCGRGALAQWTLLSSVETQTATTSSAIDTTGADLLVLAVASGSSGTGTVTDSEANSWTALTEYNTRCRISYVLSPTTNASHTFTNDGNVPVFWAAAFDAPAGTTITFDAESGNAIQGTSSQPGEVAPDSTGSILYVTACQQQSTTGTIGVDSGFTLEFSELLSGGSNVGGGMAHKASSQPAPENPTWTVTAGDNDIFASAIAVFTARTGLDFVKQGVVVSEPATMAGITTDGPYYPDIIDTSGIANHPFTWSMYFSTDHGTPSAGIWLFNANSLGGTWEEYDDTLGAGDWAALSPAATGNPIFDGGLSQTETPYLNIIGGTTVMTWHHGSGGAGNTRRSTSSNGVDFTGTTSVVDYNPAEEPGDGHSGYFRWGPNIFSGVANTYVGYNLHGGNLATEMAAQWGSDDGSTWTQLGRLVYLHHGRAETNLPGAVNDIGISLRDIDTKSIRDLGGGFYSAICHSRQGYIVEIVLDDTGRRIVREPVILIGLGSAGDDDENGHSTAILRQEGGTDYLFTKADDAAGDNAIFLSTRTTPTPNRVLADFPVLDPAEPNTDTTSYDLETTDPLPSGLSSYSSGGTVTHTPAADGHETVVATLGEHGGLITDNAIDFSVEDYVELWFPDVFGQGNPDRQIFLGLTTNNVAPEDTSGVTDAIRVYSDATSGDAHVEVTSAGSSVLSEAIDGQFWQYNLGADDDAFHRDDVTAHHALGLRIWPSEGYGVVLGHSKNEMFTIDLSSADLTASYYPFVIILANQSSTSGLKVGGLEVALEATGTGSLLMRMLRRQYE